MRMISFWEYLPPAVPWTHGHKDITFDTEASDISGMLIKLCGRDPKTLTTHEMDELDSRFECLRCVHSTQGKLVMKWRIALLHELEDHYGETLKATSYRLLDPDEVIAAKAREVTLKSGPRRVYFARNAVIGPPTRSHKCGTT
ncbi:hypothetical protein B0H14DRAFT_1229127 [Mycena olivaceomarginata]|nr:hypothetical protein B0H14DRAFT_1229127 [Mycena olivaceomarginata]